MQEKKLIIPTKFAYGTWDADIGCLGTILSRYANQGKEIHKDFWYIDNKGERKKLELLLTTVERGDLIIVGTIRDLLVATTSDLLNILRFLYNKGVEIDSGNEPHCGVIQFIEMFEVFEKMGKS